MLPGNGPGETYYYTRHAFGENVKDGHSRSSSDHCVLSCSDFPHARMEVRAWNNWRKVRILCCFPFEQCFFSLVGLPCCMMQTSEMPLHVHRGGMQLRLWHCIARISGRSGIPWTLMVLTPTLSGKPVIMLSSVECFAFSCCTYISTNIC